MHSNWITPDEAGIAISEQLEVIGTFGIAHFEMTVPGLQLWNSAGWRTTEFNIHHQMNDRTYGAVGDQLGFVADCIIDGDKGFEYLSFEDTVHVVEIADAIIQSCQTGQEVLL